MKIKSMTTEQPSSNLAAQVKEMAFEQGIVVVFCDSKGKLQAVKKNAGNWLEKLLVASPLLQQAVTKNLHLWESPQSKEIVKAFDGVWLVPINGNGYLKREESIYPIAVIITKNLLSSEYLFALCQASNADVKIVTSMIREMRPTSVENVQRLASLFQFAWNSQKDRETGLRTVESVGQELADTYEEINLLYTITGSMNSVVYPEKFFALVCNELLQTLPYRWIGIQLPEKKFQLRVDNELFTAGELHRSLAETSATINTCLEEATNSTPIIFNDDHLAIKIFGPASVLVPIVRSGNTIGAVVAGYKEGKDTLVSSVDVKLLSATTAQLSIFLDNALLYEELNDTFLGTLEALTSSIDAKDRYTCGHSQRVALLTTQLARAMNFDEEQIERFRIAGIVHDIGKIGVPESILLKEGKLTDDEFDAIKLHPEIGARILRDMPNLSDVIEGVLHHHERFDGKGYPHGLKGENIPLVARMIALADTFDAMSSTRTYRYACVRKKVLDEIRRVMGTQFDPRLAKHFLTLDFSEWEKMAFEHQAAIASHKGRKAA